MSDSKVCSKCGIEKPLTDFSPNKKSKDNHASWCHYCDNEQRRDKRKNDDVYAEVILERVRRNWNRGKERYNARRNELRHSDSEWRLKNLQQQKQSYFRHLDARREKLRKRSPEKRQRDNLQWRIKYPERQKEYNKSERGRLRYIKSNHKRRKNGFNFNPVFPSMLDESFEWHHFNHNNVDVVAIPEEFNYSCKNHRENLLPIVVQLYPDIILLCPEVFDLFPGIVVGPVL